MFTTSDTAFALIQRCEGLRLKAYQPVPGANWTIGYGQEGALLPNTPGAIPVVQGLTITEQQAEDALRFYVHNVVEPMVRLHFSGCQTQGEFDACVSWTYNINQGKLARGLYTLPDLINSPDRTPDAITRILYKLLEYHKTPGAETGLYRRRILEGIVLLGLPWNVPAVLGLLSTIRAGDDPEPVYAAAEAYHDLSENEQTAALNNAQAKSLGGKPIEYVPPDTPVAKPKAVAKAKPVETPKLDPAAPPKPMEQSKTHKGLSNADTGKEIMVTGGIAGGVLTSTLPYMDKISGYIEKTKPETIWTTMGVLLGIFMFIGLIRWMYGNWRAYEGRLEAQQPKV